MSSSWMRVWQVAMHLAAGLGLALAATVAGALEVTRVLVVDSWAPPIGRFENGRLVGGLNYDLIWAIAARGEVSPEFVMSTRQGAEGAIVEKRADIWCHTNPEWVSNPDLFLWSVPLFYQSDIVVWRSGTRPIASLADLRGKHVIGVLGYRYATLQPLIEIGSITRDDVRTKEQVLELLTLGRAEYGLTDALSLAWYLKQNPQASTLERRGFVIEQVPWRCGVRKGAPESTRRLLESIEALGRAPELQAILARYR